MLSLADHPEGCILPVRAQPGARKNAIQGEHGGALKVTVTARPQDGAANKAIIEVLREVLDLKRSQIELIAGAASRDKRFLIRGLTRQKLEERVRSLIQ